MDVVYILENGVLQLPRTPCCIALTMNGVLRLHLGPSSICKKVVRYCGRHSCQSYGDVKSWCLVHEWVQQLLCVHLTSSRVTIHILWLKFGTLRPAGESIQSSTLLVVAIQPTPNQLLPPFHQANMWDLYSVINNFCLLKRLHIKFSEML